MDENKIKMKREKKYHFSAISLAKVKVPICPRET